MDSKGEFRGKQPLGSNMAPGKRHAITDTGANNDNPFIRLGRDVHSLIINRLPVKDAVHLSSSCTTLWHKSQTALLTRLLQEANEGQSIENLDYLDDVIEFTPGLKNGGIQYRHLAITLTRAQSILDTMIKKDPRAGWKIAALCGLTATTDQLLGRELATIRDLCGRTPLDYMSLGGQLAGIVAHIKRFNPRLDKKQLDRMAKMAAIGGHIPILEYLRIHHHYDLRSVFPLNDSCETLLTMATIGGDRATVDYLLDQWADHPKGKKLSAELALAQWIKRNIGVNLAIYAANYGHWHLYYWLAKKNSPTKNSQDALEIAHYAAQHDNLELLLDLMKTYRFPPNTFFVDVLSTGRTRIFWHFVNEKWLSLKDSFANGTTVAHLLARNGHLSLLKVVLRTMSHADVIKMLDNQQQSLLHYAAMGGYWKIFAYLVNQYYHNQPLPLDAAGNTVAHTAARKGSVWFLKRLYETQQGKALVLSTNHNGNTLLHEAAFDNTATFLRMLIDDFGVPLKAKNKLGNMVLHTLAAGALIKPAHWFNIKVLLQTYGTELLDETTGDNPKNGITLRTAIKEAGAEKHFSAELLTEKRNLQHLYRTQFATPAIKNQPEDDDDTPVNEDNLIY